MDLWALLLEIVVLLAASLVAGAVFSRFGQSPLVGYLLAGMALGGPGSVQVVRAEREIEVIAELGVSLLLFSLGLEFSLTRLKKFGAYIFIGGTLQVVVTMVLGTLAAWLFGLEWPGAVVVGAMVALSSTAVVLQILRERAEIDSAHGRNSLGVLLLQDVAVVPLALMVSLLGAGGDAGGPLVHLARVVVLAAMLVVVLYLVLNKLAVYALGTLTLARNRELTIILAVVTGLGSAWAAHEVDISPALGAFLAGMFLGSSPFATQIRADVSSLRVVLLTLFFGSVGMVANPLWIVGNWYLVLGLTALVVVAKTIIVWIIFKLLGQSGPVAAATGISLAQTGEFAFVLGMIGLQNGTLSDNVYMLIVSVAIATLLVSPYLVPNALRLGALLSAPWSRRPVRLDEAGEPDHPVPDVVIFGFGPAGQMAARPFVGGSLRVLVVDLNRDTPRRAGEAGVEGMVGDATQAEVLEHAHVDHARAVVITLPHRRSALQVLDHVRRLAPEAHVIVRTRYEIHRDEFTTAGADIVVGDEQEIGDALGRHLQRWLDEQGGPAATGDA